MISITELYDDIDSLVEELTVECAKRHKDEFLESAVSFLLEEDQEVFVYFENELELLQERDDDELGIPNAKNRKRYEALKKRGFKVIQGEKGKDAEVPRPSAKKPQRTLIRKMTNKMYSTRVGKAIVRGLRRVGYGTKLGRAIMARSAKRRANKGLKQSDQSRSYLEKYKKYGKLSDNLRKRGDTLKSGINELEGKRAKVKLAMQASELHDASRQAQKFADEYGSTSLEKGRKSSKNIKAAKQVVRNLKRATSLKGIHKK